jgi:hypothetical protein
VIELARRRRLAVTAPEAQKKALVAVYVQARGLKEADALEVVERISKYELPFAEELVQHCSGVAPPDSEVFGNSHPHGRPPRTFPNHAHAKRRRCHTRAPNATRSLGASGSRFCL